MFFRCHEMVINEFTNSKPSDFAKKYGTKTDADVKIEQNLKKKIQNISAGEDDAVVKKTLPERLLQQQFCRIGKKCIVESSGFRLSDSSLLECGKVSKIT